MLKLFGLVGVPAASPRFAAAKQYLAHCAGPALLNHSVAKRAQATGSDWTCIGPDVASANGIAVVFRGDPIWRTNDAQIRGAGSPARAVLAAYERLGDRFLQVLHGAFALAVIDEAKRTTWLAVDRMGVERLCYVPQPDGLWFSTMADVVARRPGSRGEFCSQALLSYLFFHMVPSPRTIFRDVRKVPPATLIEIQSGRAKETTYWKPEFTIRGSAPAASLAQELRAALRDGVRAAGPGPASGAFLSGGLDSSTVAGVLAEVAAPRPAKSFSIGFGFADYDELRYARIASARFNLDAHEYEIEPDDIVEMFPLIADAYDEPFGNASALPTLRCARLALEHGVDHLLAGDGGDELFAGNKRYADQRVFERYQLVPSQIRRGILEPFVHAVPAAIGGPLIRKARSYIAQAKTPLPDRLEAWNFLFRLGFETIVHPELAQLIDRGEPLAHMRSVYNSAPPANVVDRMLYYDWRFTLADNDLRKVGTMCELAGVSVSYPMLHPAVIDVSLRVPPSAKMRGTALRSFYKEAMRNFLPAEIIDKKKHGFGLPFGLWLERSKPLAHLIDGNLARLRTRNIVRPEFIDQLRRLHGQDDASYYGGFVWTLAMLEQWLQAHRSAL